ncbi:MAG: NAD-binding protein, partial [Fibrobacteria bacterium]
KAKVFIVAIDDPAKSVAIAETVRKHFPHLEILCRAKDREDGYKLVNLGFQYVYRETMGTSLDMSTQALRLVGFRGHHAHRVVNAFRIYNESAFRDMAKHWHDRKTFIEQMRGKIREGETLLKEGGLTTAEVDAAWDNTSLREGMREVIGASVERNETER